MVKPTIKQRLNRWIAETFNNYTCYWSAAEFVDKDGNHLYGYRGYQYQGSYREFIPDYIGRRETDIS